MNKNVKLTSMQWVFIAVATTLIVARVLAPWAGKKYINHILGSKLENYAGSIADFDLFLLGGEYTLQGFKLYKRSVPDTNFISANEIDITLNWRQLFQGKLLMDISIDGATVNFVDGKSTKTDVSGADEKKENWKAALDEIVPLSIQNFKVKNSEVQLQIGALKNLIASQLSEINLEVYNLVDPHKQKAKLSPFKFTGLLNKHSNITVDGGVNIVKDDMTFDVNAEIKNFNIPTTNQLLKHYIPIDAQKGSLDVVFETYGSISSGRGYFKTFFKDLELFKIDQEYISGRHFLFEWLGGFANWIINAMTEGEVATEIPFLWTPGGFDVDSSEAFWKLIENSGENLPRSPKHIGPLEKK